MSGRMSPSPISSPHTASGSSTPLTSGSGALPLPFHHPMQPTTYLHEGIGPIQRSQNTFYTNGSSPYHEPKPELFRGMQQASHAFRDIISSDNCTIGNQTGRSTSGEFYDVQSVLAERVSQQLSRDYVKLNTSLDLNLSSPMLDRTNGHWLSNLKSQVRAGFPGMLNFFFDAFGWLYIAFFLQKVPLWCAPRIEVGQLTEFGSPGSLYGAKNAGCSLHQLSLICNIRDRFFKLLPLKWLNHLSNSEQEEPEKILCSKQSLTDGESICHCKENVYFHHAWSLVEDPLSIWAPTIIFDFLSRREDGGGNGCKNYCTKV